MPDDLDVLLELVDRHAQLPGNLGHLMVLQEPQMLGDDLLRRRPLEAEMAQLQQETFLEVPRGDAHRVEALNQAQRALDVRQPTTAPSPRAPRRTPRDTRRRQIADDGRPDVPHGRVVGLHRQLPHQVVGERTGRREGVLDRRQLLDFLGRPRPIALVQVVAEEVLVILVVPGVRSCWPAGRPRSSPGRPTSRPAAAPRWAPLRASGSRPSPGSGGRTAPTSTSAAA